MKQASESSGRCRLEVGGRLTVVLCVSAVRGSPAAMASAASPKRMVSSVFITLATPCRATVTQQQQPALQAHSAAACDPQRTAARVGPGDGVRSARLQRGDHSQAESHEGAGSKGRPGVGSSSKALHPQSAQLPDVGLNRGKVQRQNKGTGTWTVFQRWICAIFLKGTNIWS